MYEDLNRDHVTIARQHKFSLDADFVIRDQFGVSAVAIETVSGSRYRLATAHVPDCSEPYIVPHLFKANPDKTVELRGRVYNTRHNKPGDSGVDIVTSEIKSVELSNGAVVGLTHVDGSGRMPRPVGVAYPKSRKLSGPSR